MCRFLPALLLAAGLSACGIIDTVTEIVAPPRCEAPQTGQSHDLAVEALYVTQVTQNGDGSVPLLASRQALARAFVVNRSAADKPLDVPVVVTFQAKRRGEPLGSIQAEGPECVPLEVARADLTDSYAAQVPQSWIDEDVDVYATAHVEADLAVKDLGRLRYPRSGSLRVRTTEAPPFRLTFVPVRYPDLTPDLGPTTAVEYLSFAQQVFPLEEVDVAVRAPYRFSGERDERGDISRNLLIELRELRLLDGSERYYFGIIEPHEAFLPAGLAYLGHPVAAAVARSWGGALPVGIIAHELGHNFGLRHAPCGDPDGIDINFPYSDGGIGVHGFDAQAGTIVDVNHKDLMSYCRPQWISDYHYLKVLEFRKREALAAQTSKELQQVLLVSGSIDRDGLRLRPLFVTEAAVYPPEPGPYRLLLLDEAAEVLFETSFSTQQISDHSGRHVEHFAFTLPAKERWNQELHAAYVLDDRGNVLAEARASRDLRLSRTEAAVRAMRLEDGRVKLTWPSDSFAAALVRDPSTREVLSRDETGEVTFPYKRDELEVILSDGVQSLTLNVSIEVENGDRFEEGP